MIILFACNANIFAYDTYIKPDLNNQAKYILPKAIIAFEDKNYYEAFELAQNAKESRKNESIWASSVLKDALLSPNAQKIGTDIQTLLYFFKQRQNDTVVNVIETVLKKYSIEYFDYNIENLVDFLALTENFPEADFLLGKLYFLEGELAIAEKYLLQAFDYKTLLNVPDQQYDILYSLANLYKLQNNNESYEQSLLLIIGKDNLNVNVTSLLKSAKKSIDNDMSVDKFFLFYREDSYVSLEAWYNLAKLYIEKNEWDLAYDAAIAMNLISFTRIDEVLKDRDIHYQFTTLSEFLKALKSFNDIDVWAIENNVWEGFYLLAQISSKMEYKNFAKELLVNLAMECPQREWRILSERTLSNF